MNTFRLYMDDDAKYRPTPSGFNVRTYTVEQTIVFLKTRKVEAMSLDHDLGWDEKKNEERKNGEMCLNWLETIIHADHSFPIPTIWIHSANGVGVERMNRVLESIERIRQRREERKSSSPAPNKVSE